MINDDEFSILIPHLDRHIVGDGKLIVELHKMKSYGRIWKFNLNDKDQFPSNPHGHDIENGDKLNVFTGEIYNKDRRLIAKLSDKQLIHLKIKLKDTHHAID